MAEVVRLTTRPERVKRETAAAIVAQLLLFSEQDLPAQPRAAILNALARVTHPDTETSIWGVGYMMIHRRETKVVWDAIRQLPRKDRPQEVRHCFDLVLLNIRQDNGEIMMTRDEMAEEIGCAPREVSKAMNVLWRMGVLERELRKVAGMRGPGMVVWFINPHVAWNGSLAIRQKQAIPGTQPSLHLIPAG
jgi:CRP-like cAMP-binding protein